MNRHLLRIWWKLIFVLNIRSAFRKHVMSTKNLSSWYNLISKSLLILTVSYRRIFSEFNTKRSTILLNITKFYLNVCTYYTTIQDWRGYTTACTSIRAKIIVKDEASTKAARCHILLNKISLITLLSRNNNLTFEN